MDRNTINSNAGSPFSPPIFTNTDITLKKSDASAMYNNPRADLFSITAESVIGLNDQTLHAMRQKNEIRAGMRYMALQRFLEVAFCFSLVIISSNTSNGGTYLSTTTSVPMSRYKAALTLAHHVEKKTPFLRPD